MLPRCLRSAKMRLSSELTSRAISAWIDAAFFSSGVNVFLRGPSATDLLVDLDEGAFQLPVTPEILDFAFGLCAVPRAWQSSPLQSCHRLY
jgi:hypothetical protein